MLSISCPLGESRKRFSIYSMRTKPGEVWLADLGIAGKTRPILIVSREDRRRMGCGHGRFSADAGQVRSPRAGAGRAKDNRRQHARRHRRGARSGRNFVAPQIFFRQHPEGYLEAFANLYSDIAKAVVARLCRKSLDQVDRAFPTVEDGVKGLAFVEAAVRSSASHRWEPLESPAI